MREYLAGYAGKTVIIRYEPRDITEILVYRQEENKEVFLARAFAQNLETETIALDEAKASSKKVREAGKTISNRSILNEIRAPQSGSLRDRDLFTPPDKKTRQQRQKEEQAELPAQKKFSQAEDFNEVERGRQRLSPQSQAKLGDGAARRPTASRQAQVSFEEEEEISLAESETQRVEVLDYEDLLDDYGF